MFAGGAAEGKGEGEVVDPGPPGAPVEVNEGRHFALGEEDVGGLNVAVDEGVGEVQVAGVGEGLSGFFGPSAIGVGGLGAFGGNVGEVLDSFEDTGGIGFTARAEFVEAGGKVEAGLVEASKGCTEGGGVFGMVLTHGTGLEEGIDFPGLVFYGMPGEALLAGAGREDRRTAPGQVLDGVMVET